jgi:hypothetical protein
MFIFIDILKRYHHTTEFDRRHAEELLLAPGAEGAKGADTMLKAMRNINSLCDAFQVGF